MHIAIFTMTFLFSLSAFCASDFQAVNLNAASSEQIQILPGVGKKLAERIVAHRKENGPFASLDDLLLVKGMHPKMLEELVGKAEFSKSHSPASNKTPKLLEDSKNKLEQKMELALEILNREPKAKVVQEQALRYAMAEPSRALEWQTRARVAPSLPSLGMSLGRGSDSDATLREKEGDASVFSKKDSTDFNINVKLEWRLSELLFNQNELRVARESFRMAVIRERIMSDVTKAYIERKKTKIKILTATFLAPLERAELDLRIEELDAILDSLTGGWFSENTVHS